MFHFFAHLRFLAKATNQHGVHSPFIYNYITKCLYKKGKLHQQKNKNILLKSIAYFNTKTIYVTTEKIKNNVNKVYPSLKHTSNIVDFAYLDAPDLLKLNALNYHNDTTVFINNIYRSKETKETWIHIKNLDKVTVTVDLFYCAIVFFRKEQAKEHFKIRI